MTADRTWHDPLRTCVEPVEDSVMFERAFDAAVGVIGLDIGVLDVHKVFAFLTVLADFWIKTSDHAEVSDFIELARRAAVTARLSNERSEK